MSRRVDCYIGIGSNLGNRLAYIRKAIWLISEQIGKLTAKSFTYESEPWGSFEGETYPYLNAVVLVKTDLYPQLVLRSLQDIEHSLGRVRSSKNAPRTIDLDILYYGDQVIQSEKLVIPHPHLSERRFVLQPLLDIAPMYVHPTLALNTYQLLQNCTDLQQELPRV